MDSHGHAPDSAETRNLAVALAYMEALSDGGDRGRLAELLHEEIALEVFPNRIAPHGHKGDRAAMLAASKRGAGIVAGERYQVLGSVVAGDRVALEVEWTATLRVPFQGLPEGGRMRAHVAVFLELRDGRIVAQRNYDCYQPW